ncbi:MAG: YdcH family protein [Candidatus Adiutrix sp.]|nr:YdcH family protein [Candidatus Adiutrix sp.]
MELQEKALINKLIPNNPELAALVDEHQAFENQLDEMNHRAYLSPEDDLERKKIQKAKLAVKDRIQRILDENRG